MITNIVCGVLLGGIFVIFFVLYPSPRRSLWWVWRHRCRHIDGWKEYTDKDRFFHQECVMCHKEKVSVK